jgi:hypothetical protein
MTPVASSFRFLVAMMLPAIAAAKAYSRRPRLAEAVGALGLYSSPSNTIRGHAPIHMDLCNRGLTPVTTLL